MKIIKKTKKDYKTSTWGGGKTEEIFIYPTDADYTKRDFNVRISSASIEIDKSEFTELKGVKRFITPLNFNMHLSVNDENVSLAPFDIYEFNGSDKTVSFGKGLDFNLMLKGRDGLLECIDLAIGELTIKTECSLLAVYSADAKFIYNDIEIVEGECIIFSEIDVEHLTFNIRQPGKLLLSYVY